MIALVKKFSLIALSLMMLAACGGGGGGKPPADPPAGSSNWDSMKWNEGNWA